MKQKIFMLCVPVGLLALFFGIFLGANQLINDFSKGFLEGAGATLAFIGAAGIIFQAVQNRK